MGACCEGDRASCCDEPRSLVNNGTSKPDKSVLDAQGTSLANPMQGILVDRAVEVSDDAPHTIQLQNFNTDLFSPVA